MRQQRVHDGAVAPDGVDAEDEGERGGALAPHEGQPSRFRFQHRALAATGAAAEGLAMLLDLLADLAVAADPGKVSAGGLVLERGGQGALEPADVGLHLADALEVLVLAEGRLDAPAQDLGRRAAGQQHGRPSHSRA